MDSSFFFGNTLYVDKKAIRFNFAFSDSLCYILLFISRITMFISGLGARFEFDLKKIIALTSHFY
jgi:hypothetical protein